MTERCALVMPGPCKDMQSWHEVLQQSTGCPKGTSTARSDGAVIRRWIGECQIFCVRGFRSMLKEKGSMDHGKDNR